MASSGNEVDDAVLENVLDGGGAPLTLQKVGGHYFPTFPSHVIRNIPSVRIRPDDVLLTGYLKAGTHWVWEILRMLRAGTTDVSNVEKDVAMIEQIEQAQLDNLPSPRVLNTHVRFEQLPTEVLEKRPKIVYLTRNPKDTVVSMYHHHIGLNEYYHYNGEFGDYLQLFYQGKVDYGSWFDHLASWSAAHRAHPELPFMEVNYEDLSEHTEQKIKELADFLGVSASDDLIRQIHQMCSIESMRKRKAQFDLDASGESIMYRKGKVGGWINHFTMAQNELFDEEYNQRLKQMDCAFHWRFRL